MRWIQCPLVACSRLRAANVCNERGATIECGHCDGTNRTGAIAQTSNRLYTRAKPHTSRHTLCTEYSTRQSAKVRIQAPGQHPLLPYKRA